VDVLAAAGCPKASDAVGAVLDVTAGIAAVDAGAPKPNCGAEEIEFSFFSKEGGAADTEAVLPLDFAPKEKLIGGVAGTETAGTADDVDVAAGVPKLKAGTSPAFGVAVIVLGVVTATEGREKEAGTFAVFEGAAAALAGIPKEGKELEGADGVPVAVVVELGNEKDSLGAAAAAGTVDKRGVVVPGNEKLKAGFGEDEAAVPREDGVVATGPGTLNPNFGNSGAETDGTLVIATATLSTA
jgi:hypothetical protein